MKLVYWYCTSKNFSNNISEITIFDHNSNMTQLTVLKMINSFETRFIYTREF